MACLESSISGDTVCGLLSYGLEFEEPRLIDQCLVFIRENVCVLEFPSTPNSLSEEALCMIAKDNHIGIEEVCSNYFLLYVDIVTCHWHIIPMKYTVSFMFAGCALSVVLTVGGSTTDAEWHKHGRT